MRRTLLLCMLMLSFALALCAQTEVKPCYMYTYSDEWPDESNSLLALNATTSDACGNYSTSANVQVTMPSGYSQSAWDSGEFAQAIALAPFEAGQGTVSGENVANYDCGVVAATI